MHENSRLLFNAYARQRFADGQRVLEIGPDGFPSTYRKEVGDLTNLTWDTLDIFPSDQLTYPASDPYHFPIENDSYDVVLAGQVIEHVPKIWVWIQEVQRVCKPGGTVVIINPVSWDYHEAPVDCWRIYPEGMRALMEDTELEIEECTFRSLEEPGRKRYLPGRAYSHQDPKIRDWGRRLARFGLPIECAFDTITVARRRSI
ncbi:MAG: methyltransferase domain-containing protein [Acidimicrobiaceae bacterium]|nr:methyltransferase domain-containing protein [Acidimicrobiaceae bacterium]